MKLLTIENWRELDPWIRKAPYKEYNSNIITMLMWNKMYPLYYKIYDHFALVCFSYHNAKHWFMPYCEDVYRKEATEEMLSYSKKHNIPLGIHSITQEYKDFLEEQYPFEVVFENHVSAEDYVYDRKQQEMLSGKKMQKRRNHFNAFLKENENRFSYFPLGREHFSAIYELLKRWQSMKEESETIEEEETGIRFLLDHFEELSLYGGCIYIDGKLEAFSIASLISEDMVQIHVEKANREIRGLYVAILKCFLETLPEEVTLVNREDDMGLASLRKAKRDMKPLYKVKKYMAVFDQVQIVHPRKEDEHAMQDLWRASFTEETEATTHFFFQHVYRREYAYIMKNSQTLMAMAYLNPWEMRIDGERKTVFFLEGVATEEDFQRCGVMKKLLQHIFHEQKGAIFALQAYDWELYKPFGFVETHALQRVTIQEEKMATRLGTLHTCEDASVLYYLYESFVVDKDAYRIRDLSYYTHFYIPYQQACGNDILLYVEEGKIGGYVTMHENEESIEVEEIVYMEEDILQQMLSLLAQKGKVLHVMLDMQAKYQGEQEPALMMWPSIERKNTYFVNESL